MNPTFRKDAGLLTVSADLAHRQLHYVEVMSSTDFDPIFLVLRGAIRVLRLPERILRPLLVELGIVDWASMAFKTMRSIKVAAFPDEFFVDGPSRVTPKLFLRISPSRRDKPIELPVTRVGD